MTDQASRSRIVEHCSPQGAWRMEFLTPTQALSPFVSRLTAYAERDTRFVRRRELPSGLATLVFNLGQELRVEHPADVSTSFGAGGAFYSGLSSVYAVTHTNGAQEGAQAMLTPLGARRLLGFPLEEVGDRLIDPADLFGDAARETVERLQEADFPTQRLAILEQMMERRLLQRGEGEPPRDLIWALRRLRRSCGRINVTALAAEIGCSRKHLSVRFKREFGMAPKLFARVLRFQRALALLGDRTAVNWAQLADFCGYADQAHLSRDFSAFAGAPPGAFLRRALPDEGGFTD
jgi:AraC-like DNA-binding protein